MQFELKMPLLGFESIKTMKLEKIDDIFMRLTSDQDERATFTLINPFVLTEYDFVVPTAIETLLQINDDANILIFNVVIVQSPIENSTINFAAPIVFNTDTMSMAQVILENNSLYSIAEPISNFLRN